MTKVEEHFDLTDWNWDVEELPEDKWVKVLMPHGEKYHESIARWKAGTVFTTGSWTLAPGDHIWGPVVAWRPLREEERP